jgi:hypothetical protein
MGMFGMGMFGMFFGEEKFACAFVESTPIRYKYNSHTSMPLDGPSSPSFSSHDHAIIINNLFSFDQSIGVVVV